MSSSSFLRITGRIVRLPCSRQWTLSRTSRIYAGTSNIGQRWASSASSTSLPRASWRRPQIFVAGGLLLLIGVGTSNIFSPTIRADSDDNEDKDNSTKSSDSLSSLIRSYIVYSLCSIPALVDSAPTLLQAFTNIPVIGNITEGLVRVTFFNQFVGGDTAAGTIPLLRALRLSNKGALFAYSIEVDEHEATAHSAKKQKSADPTHKRIVNEMIRSIDVAADFEDGILKGAPTGRRTWVAVKMTALLPDAQSLINLSKFLIDTRTPLPVPFPGCPRSTDLDVLYGRHKLNRNGGPLSDDDVIALRELHQDLRRICARAQQRGVKIILDAEYSWYQPAIDALQLSLMREFNTTASKDLSIPNVQPLIYGTFQAYLRRTPAYLEEAFKDAQMHNYSLGVKLVRGAYHPHEVAALKEKKKGKLSFSITPESQPPVWSTKDETDRCYDGCLKKLIVGIKDDIQSNGPQPMLGVLFGTHNWSSSRLILSELVRNGVAREERVEGEREGVVVVGNEVTERVTLGQLYGMNDALSDYLVRRTSSSAPLVIKYVPYGALSEVMPYLSRRAIENKSVLGNGTAREERIRARKAIVGKLFG
ncbi:hypothetical protein E1B28_009686 [Marasmius oreades]|uniref:Proline dehydrogenase n=1 Tax=Marasmius oreades TaxID=181124 RepID=A0A9P7RVK0_9AGAR|nr:uncharacterized protein E1B28_009686 [Marasmius oreades]KAG7090579.1 hypothetical protein E1B28_009686 [Marasmius oreades]